MSLLLIDGFEDYGTTVDSYPTGLDLEYAVSSQTNVILTTGRIGGYALKVGHNVSGQSVAIPSQGNLANWIVGFAFKPGDNLVDTRLFSLYETSTEQFALRMTAGGELQVYRGTTLIATTSGANLAVNTWCYIEVKVTIGNSGSYEVRLNGVNVLSNGTVDTQQTTNAYAQTLRLWGVFNSTSGNRTTFDDLYIADTTAGEVSDFVGSQKVESYFPSAEGDQIDFTPSTGTDNSALVDENPTNGDTDYVESGTVGHRDLYQFGNTSLTGIKGVQINAFCRETDASPFSVKLLAKSNVTVAGGSGFPVGGTTYVGRRRVLEQDPNTAAAWTASGVNAAQFGIEVA